MTKAEIKNSIIEVFNSPKYLDETYYQTADRLTDLFIQLSEERCKDQREICAHECNVYTNVSFGTSNVILHAPLPAID